MEKSDNLELTDELQNIPVLNKGWNDCTDSKGSGIRKQSFKVFQKSPEFQLVHIFKAGKYYDVDYYHVVHETFGDNKSKPVGDYYLLTKNEIFEKFELSI